MEMIRFLFTCFYEFSSNPILYPMLGLIFVFGTFRLTWFLINGGYFNE